MQGPAAAKQGFALPAYFDPAGESFATHNIAAIFTPDSDMYTVTVKPGDITRGALRLVNRGFGIGEL